MPTGTFEYQSDDQRAAIEQAIAFVTEMHQLAQAAPAGQVLPLCESRALDQGRALLRDTLQAAVQGRVDAAEKKGGPPGPVRAPAVTTSNGGVAAT